MVGDDFRNSRRWIARLGMIACALAVSACSQGSALEPRPDAASASAAASANTDPQTCRPDHALLVPQPAPDCGFGRANLKTVDPDQWSRFEYELKCYKEAEKIARAPAPAAVRRQMRNIGCALDADRSVGDATIRSRRLRHHSHFFAPLGQHSQPAVKFG